MKKGFRFQIVGYSFILFILLFTVPCTLYPTYAADSSPSADIKSKLEELKKEIASKAAKLKQEVGRKLTNKAYVGKVKASSETSLTLAAASGPKVVSINQDTVFENKQSLPSKDGKLKPKQKFSQKSISLEDDVVALGDVDETGVLIAKKVLLLLPTKLPPKTYLWGQIISISDRLVTLKDQDFKNVAASLPAELRVKINDFVIITGNKDKNDIFKAQFVYVIPQGATLKPKRVVSPSMLQRSGATPSASAKVASPSGKPAKKAN